MKRLMLLFLCAFVLAATRQTSLAGGTPLTVVFTSPEGDMTRPEDGVVVMFDRPMVPLGPAVARSEGPVRLEPAVAGTWRWLGTRTVAFYPSTLVSATTYTALVPAGTKALDGSALQSERRFTFRTARPALVRTIPYEAERLPEPPARLLLAFDAAVDPARAAPAIKVGSEGVDVPVNVRAMTSADLPPDTDESKWAAGRVLVVEPQAALPRGTAFKLEVRAGMRGRDGDLGTAEAKAVSFSTVGPLAFDSVQDGNPHDPDQALVLLFNNEVHPADLARHAKLEPPLPVLPAADHDYASTSVPLGVSLRPATKYRLTLDAALPDAYGNKLGRTVTVDVVTSDRLPMVQAPVGPRTLEAYLPLQLPVGFVNGKGLRLRGVRADRGSVVPLLEAYARERWRPRSPLFEKAWQPPVRRNELAFKPLDLGPWLPGGYGMLALAYDPGKSDLVDLDSNYNAYQSSVFVQATRMGLTAKFAPESTLLWVTDLENTRSLAGVDVEIRDQANKVRWRGQTDAAGIATGPGRMSLGLDEEARLYAIASRGRDVAVISSQWGAAVGVSDFHISRGWIPLSVPEVLAFTDRGLYRPGDKVHVKAILRSRKGDQWIIPRAEALRVAFRDSRGEVAAEKTVKLGRSGAFDLSLALPPTAKPGMWSVRVLAGKDQDYGGGDFRVEAYRPAQFEVKVSADPDDLVAGQTLRARITGRYLFGAPMPSAPVKWSLMATPERFEPRGWEGMSFGPDPWLDWRDDPPEQERLQHKVEATLDAQGSVLVSAPVRLRDFRGAARLTVQATVSDTDQTPLTGKALVWAHPAGVYVGLQPDATFLAENATFHCKSVVVTPDGRPAKARPLQIELVRRTYKSVRQAYGAGSRWVSTPQDVIVQTADGASGTATLKTAGPGMYLVRGRGKDDDGRMAETTTSVYVYGASAASWSRNNDAVILTPDRRQYQVGDVARVAIASPFAKARALVTVERDGVLERFVAEVQGGAPVVRIPIREAYAPNVFVSVGLIQGRTGRNRFSESGDDLAKPTFRLGYVKLPVDPKGHRLKISVKPEKTTYAPGDTVDVDLQVDDASGQGRAAEVTFVAADRGVLDLIDYHLPDPLATFFEERRLSVETCETRHHVVGQHRYGEKGRPGGGGGEGPERGGLGAYRWNFEATPCWRPSVETDARGHARVSFKLPDSVTAFRLSAVAHTTDARFGRGESEVRARRPLAITPSWPRFCMIGDDATAGVIVHNQTGAAGTVTVSVKAEGAEIVGAASQDLALGAGESKTVRFPFHTARLGKARFSFDARLGTQRDGLQAIIPVNAPRLTEAAAMRESTAGTVSVPLAVPADVVPGTARLDLTLASTALAGLAPAVQYLRGYRYECLEQKLSRVMPVLTAHDVVEAFGATPAGASRDVQAVLDGMAALQSGEGGFGLWRAEHPSPWVTAYAMHLAALAKAQGFRVDERVAKKALGYLEGVLTAGDDDPRWAYDRSGRAHLGIRAYALMVLGLWGRHDAATANLLYERRAKLPLSGRAWLLRAMAADGRKTEAAALARELLNGLHVDPAGAHFEDRTSDLGGMFESPTRLNAVVLEALLASGHDFESAASVVAWLVDQRKDGRWRTTQENAMVFAALSAWYRTHERVAPDFVARVRVAGRDVLAQTFKGRDLGVVSRSVDLSGGAVPLDVTRTGTGTLHMSARLRYATRTPGEAADAGLSVAKIVEVVEGTAEAPYATGTLLRVRLVVSNPAWRPWVVVDDPLGGGLEAVNTAFATERDDLGEKRDEQWWGGFDHREMHDDRVVLVAENLSPGVHQYTYYARAAFPGRYLVGPTHAEAMYEPEIFGRTAASEVTVK